MVEQEPEKRMETIMEESWELLKARIVNGSIDIGDEADMQFHLGTIMDKVGQIYCLTPEEGFSVHFEHDEPVEGETNKVDLVCTLHSKEKEVSTAIELKRKKENHPANKGSSKVYQDLRNLEALKQDKGYDKAYFYMLTDWDRYLSTPEEGSARSVFGIYEGAKYESGEKLAHETIDGEITLDNSYLFEWDSKEGHHFLSIEV